MYYILSPDYNVIGMSKRSIRPANQKQTRDDVTAEDLSKHRVKIISPNKGKG